MSDTKANELNSKTSYVGTCQACFGGQVVKATRGRVHTLVLHGYLRPGFGYIKGQCAGVNEQPYELSCEATKRWKAHCEGNLENQREYLAAYEADRIDSYDAVVPDHDAPKARWGEPRPTKIVTIKRGEKYVDPKYGRQEWTFEDQRQRTIRTTKEHIQGLEETIAFLAERIAAWKYAPELLKTHETVQREAREARQEAQLAAGFRRNWKNLWKYIADAIRSHKDHYKQVEEYRERVKLTDAEHRKQYDEANARFGLSQSFEEYLPSMRQNDARNLERLERELVEKFNGMPFMVTKVKKQKNQ